jgi:hypothetical protein
MMTILSEANPLKNHEENRYPNFLKEFYPNTMYRIASHATISELFVPLTFMISDSFAGLMSGRVVVLELSVSCT